MKKILFSIVLLCSGLSLWAQAPEKFNYQGVARLSTGMPMVSQPISMRITIMDGSETGTVVYSETQSTTTNAYGLYNVAIGAGTPETGTMADVNWGSGEKYIKVELDPDGGADYTEIGVSQLLSVPYAMYATSGTPGPAGPEGATGPEGPAGSANISGTTNMLVKFTDATTGGDSQIEDDGTTVGINTPTLDADIKLQVTASDITNGIRSLLGTAPSTSIATAGSIYGESSTGIGVIGVSGSQNGVYGLSTGSLGGTVGVSTGTGNGIWGVATSTGVAGYFDGGSSGGRGIIVSTGSSGIGTTTPNGRLMVVQPSTPVTAIDTFPAITGYSYTAKGCLKGGVFGNYNGSNYGTGLQGIGYNGVNNQDANTTFGVGNQDLGVYGSANTAGVMGASIGGIGVVGYNKNASFAATTGIGNTYGVYGNAQTVGGATVPTTRYGVYGFASGATTNYAGYFSGNVNITGSIAKGSGTFKIDHPLDPENKYLYHSFVESPDMMNIYNGNVTTNAEGYAIVQLPAYFDALNKDFRYQLTVIGTFAQAIVSEEVSGNKFVIQTSRPDVKVSWQVTGIRHDKYADAHRVVAEVEKEPEFKGRYLHAVEWGKPESASIDAVTRPKSEMPAVQKTVQQTSAPDLPNTDKAGVAGVDLKARK